LTLSDGVTPVGNVSLTFSAPAGVTFSQCGLNVCSWTTDQSGTAGMGVVATAAGTYTLTVAYGAVTASTQMVATAAEPQLILVSAPTGSVPVGTVASQALTAQLLDKNGNPWSGMDVTLGGPLGAVSMGCEPRTGSCVEATDANGMVTSQVTPLQAGTITLEAVFQNLVVQSSFTATGTGDVYGCDAAAGDRERGNSRELRAAGGGAGWRDARGEPCGVLRDDHGDVCLSALCIGEL
jgi:hypothetical protein